MCLFELVVVDVSRVHHACFVYRTDDVAGVSACSAVPAKKVAVLRQHAAALKQQMRGDDTTAATAATALPPP